MEDQEIVICSPINTFFTHLDKAEPDVVLANAFVLLGEESRGRDPLKLPVLAQPLDKPVVFVFILLTKQQEQHR